MRPDRTLALWCPDWTFVAAGLDPATDAAITLRAGRVAACSHTARADGVRRGMRRREAQSRSPGIAVLDDDPAQSARAFEPVVEVVAALVPSVEVVRPGLCAVVVRRAARAFGGETRLAGRLAADIHGAIGVAVETGIADGVFAAVLAAREGRVVPPGGTPAFLAPFPIGVLDRPDLSGLLSRLGLHTLGAFAALPAADVLDRFGAEGAWAHHLAAGTEQRVRRSHTSPADLVVESRLDPPVERVDAAAFVARTLAEALHARLHEHGLTCLRVSVEAETADGQTLLRVWRHDGTLSAAALADRVRWQLDGWLSGTLASPDGRPSAGISLLRLEPDQLLPAHGRQLDLVRDAHAPDPERVERVDRALTRVQGLLGHDAVVTAVLVGGRDPVEQVRLVPWTDPRPPVAGTAAATAGTYGLVSRVDSAYQAVGSREGGAPWPGRLPDPAPATVLTTRLPAQVRDARGAPVGVTGRATVTAAPAQIRVDRNPGHIDRGQTSRGQTSRGQNDRGQAGRGHTDRRQGDRGETDRGQISRGQVGHGYTDRGQSGRGRTGDDEGGWLDVEAWAGPWPADTRWWDPVGRRRRARFQMVTTDGRAWLLTRENESWYLDAVYD